MIIEIPEELGVVANSFEGNSNKTVVIIADKFEDNYFYEKCLARILEYLITEFGLKKIFVEGGWGNVNLDYLRKEASKERRLEVAEEYLKSGKISGEEYLDIISEFPVELIGADVKTIHEESQSILLGMQPYLDKFYQVMDVLKRNISTVREKLSDPTLELDLRNEEYKANKIHLVDLFKLYVEKAKNLGINVGKNYPVFFSLATRIGITTPFEWLLQRNCSLDDLLSLSAEKLIYSNGLLDDERRIEEEIKEKLYQNQEQREVSQIYKDLETLVDIVTLQIQAHQFEYFKNGRHRFSSTVFSDFLTKYGLGISNKIEVIDDLLPQMEKFYECCRERQKNFIEVVTNQTMDVDLSSLILGGFHIRWVTPLAQEKGFSYVIVFPNEIEEKKRSNIPVVEKGRQGYLDILKYKGGKSERVEVLSADEWDAFKHTFPEYAQYQQEKEMGKGLYKKAVRLVNPNNPDKASIITLKVVDLWNLHERALEYIRRKGFSNPIEAFEHEARRIDILKRLKNTHISKVLNTKLSSTNRFYFFVERYSERTLAGYIEDNHPLPYGAVIDIALQLADGLAAIHKSNYYHGDLKPDNILWRNAIINITDFDLTSSIPDEGEKKALATYSCVLAPEVFEHEHLSPKSDIWAYGTDIYYVRVGKPPFPIDFHGSSEDWINVSFEERRKCVRESVYPKIKDNKYYGQILEDIQRNFDHNIASILVTCLEREPTRRYKDAIELNEVIKARN